MPDNIGRIGWMFPLPLDHDGIFADVSDISGGVCGDSGSERRCPAKIAVLPNSGNGDQNLTAW